MDQTATKNVIFSLQAVVDPSSRREVDAFAAQLDRLQQLSQVRISQLNSAAIQAGRDMLRQQQLDYQRAIDARIRMETEALARIKAMREQANNTPLPPTNRGGGDYMGLGSYGGGGGAGIVAGGSSASRGGFDFATGQYNTGRRSGGDLGIGSYAGGSGRPASGPTNRTMNPATGQYEAVKAARDISLAHLQLVETEGKLQRAVNQTGNAYENLSSQVRNMRREMLATAAESTGALMQMTRGFVTLGMVGEKDLKKVMEGLMTVQAWFDMLSGGTRVVLGFEKVLHLYTAASRAAAAAQDALTAAQGRNLAASIGQTALSGARALGSRLIPAASGAASVAGGVAGGFMGLGTYGGTTAAAAAASGGAGGAAAATTSMFGVAVGPLTALGTAAAAVTGALAGLAGTIMTARSAIDAGGLGSGARPGSWTEYVGNHSLNPFAWILPRIPGVRPNGKTRQTMIGGQMVDRPDLDFIESPLAGQYRSQKELDRATKRAENISGLRALFDAMDQDSTAFLQAGSTLRGATQARGGNQTAMANLQIERSRLQAMEKLAAVTEKLAQAEQQRLEASKVARQNMLAGFAAMGGHTFSVGDRLLTGFDAATRAEQAQAMATENATRTGALVARQNLMNHLPYNRRGMRRLMQFDATEMARQRYARDIELERRAGVAVSRAGILARFPGIGAHYGAMVEQADVAEQERGFAAGRRGLGEGSRQNVIALEAQRKNLASEIRDAERETAKLREDGAKIEERFGAQREANQQALNDSLHNQMNLLNQQLALERQIGTEKKAGAAERLSYEKQTLATLMNQKQALQDSFANARDRFTAMNPAERLDIGRLRNKLMQGGNLTSQEMDRLRPFSQLPGMRGAFDMQSERLARASGFDQMFGGAQKNAIGQLDARIQKQQGMVATLQAQFDVKVSADTNQLEQMLQAKVGKVLEQLEKTAKTAFDKLNLRMTLLEASIKNRTLGGGNN